VHSSGHNRLQEFRFEYGVIADETTDVSTTEQIYLCVRYVGVDSDGEMCVKESFLGFAERVVTVYHKYQSVHFVWWVIDTWHLGDCFANE
jgi:hypothetical protein